jgi:hypothetical protein
MLPRSVLLRLAIGLSVVFQTLSLSAGSLWYGDKDGLHRIDTATNAIAASVPFEPATAIAVNSTDGSLWVVSQQRIARLSEHGSVQFTARLRDLGNGLGAPRFLVLDPNNGSVWVGFENRVLHLDAAGALQHTIAASANDLAIAQDGSVWILGNSALQQYDTAGALVRSIAVTQRFKHLGLDDAGNAVWLAGEKDLVQLIDGQQAQTILAPETIAGISVDLQTGDVWAIGQNGLFSYGRDARPRVSRDLRDFSIANPQALLFDFSSQAAWVGHQRGLTRVTSAGTIAASFPAAVHVATIAIGRTPLNITPAVSIVAPANGALINTATPQLRVDYDALCGTTPCGFPNSFFSTYTLFALLNGSEIGASFVFDPATGGASYTPSAPLNEGTHTFSASARDSFGRTSDTAASTFTVDTIAPSFINVLPANASVLTNASIAITGSVDDAAATVTLGGQTPQGQTFTFPVTLVEGVNSFTLVARDPAGNTAMLPLTYTYEPPNVLPSVAIASPAHGANFTAPASFLVSANATDSDGTIARVDFYTNGVLAVTDDAAPFEAALANLAAGSYTLTAQATDNRGGATMSAPVGITVGPPNALPLVQLTAPAATASFVTPATIAMTAVASDPDGTIAKVEFLRNGAVEATVTTAPYAATLTNVAAGTYSLAARATDDRGGITTSAIVSVVVKAPSIAIDSPLPSTTLPHDIALVRGRIVAPANSGVKVNDFVATVDAAGNYAVLIPVIYGSNTIVATLTMPDRTTATASITLPANGVPSQMLVEATPSVGYAPLTTTFTVTNPTSTNVTFTFDGVGPYFLGGGQIARFTGTYQPGIVTPTIVFNVLGTTFTQRLVVDVRGRAKMDQMFRTLWSDFSGALAAGNKDAAMRMLSENAQEKYGPVFDALMPFFPEIVASYSPLAQSSLTENIAEYAVTRMDGGVKRLYLIYFVRDANGVWRIDTM